MSKNFKRFLVSTLITFVSVFAVAFGAAISNPEFTFSSASISALVVSALIAATRAVAKLVVEFSSGYLSK